MRAMLDRQDILAYDCMGNEFTINYHVELRKEHQSTFHPCFMIFDAFVVLRP